MIGARPAREVGAAGADPVLPAGGLAGLAGGLPLPADLLTLRLRSDRTVRRPARELAGAAAAGALRALASRRLRPGAARQARDLEPRKRDNTNDVRRRAE